MELVRIAVLSLAACGLAAAADFGIDIGSPVAAAPIGDPGAATVSKLKGAVFSVRTHGCSVDSKLTALAKYAGGAEYPLSLIPSPSPKIFVATGGRRETWLAVITADCMGTKAGALVPIDAQGLYQRDAMKLLPHAPTTAEVDEAFKKLQGGSK